MPDEKEQAPPNTSAIEAPTPNPPTPAVKTRRKPGPKPAAVKSASSKHHRTPKDAVRITQRELVAICAGHTEQEIGVTIKGYLKRGRGDHRGNVINMEQVVMLASHGWKQEEIAAFFNVDHKTLVNRINRDPSGVQFLERGKLMGTGRLRSAQYQAAVIDKNPTMLIWMGKQMLGQRDIDIMETSDRVNELLQVMRIAKSDVGQSPLDACEGTVPAGYIDMGKVNENSGSNGAAITEGASGNGSR